MKLPAIVTKDKSLYVALALDVDIASQGSTIEEALKNLQEALELYLEDEDAIIPSTSKQTMITFVKVRV